MRYFALISYESSLNFHIKRSAVGAQLAASSAKNIEKSAMLVRKKRQRYSKNPALTEAGFLALLEGIFIKKIHESTRL